MDVFNNVLSDNNEVGWRELQSVSSGSQTLLQNTERYATYLAAIANDTEQPMVLARENIGKFWHHYMHTKYNYTAIEESIHLIELVHAKNASDVAMDNILAR